MLQLTSVLPLQVSWVVVSQTAASAAEGLVQARSSSQVDAAATQLKTAVACFSSDGGASATGGISGGGAYDAGYADVAVPGDSATGGTSGGDFLVPCQAYYNDWLAGGGCTACVQTAMSTLASCPAAPAGSPAGCTLANCEPKCGSTAASCGCIQACLGDCEAAVLAYYRLHYRARAARTRSPAATTSRAMRPGTRARSARPGSKGVAATSPSIPSRTIPRTLVGTNLSLAVSEISRRLSSACFQIEFLQIEPEPHLLDAVDLGLDDGPMPVLDFEKAGK
jgi:hypothetical protein